MSIFPFFKRIASRTNVALVAVFILASVLPLFVTFPPAHVDQIDRALLYVRVVAFFLQAMIWASAAVSYWAERYITHHRVHPGDATTIQAVAVLVKVIIGAFLVVSAFEAVGSNVAGLVAGLGVGGIAVAFALQSLLGDVFGAMSIVLDKPFVVGDFITIDTYAGTVQHIGLKSTRLTSVDGEQIIISNGDLLKARIRNYGRMEQRRVVVKTRVSAATPPAQLARVPEILRNAVQSIPETRLTYANLRGIGDTWFEFETAYYLLTTDYNRYMDAQQAFTLAVTRELDAAGIELAAHLESAQRVRIAGRDSVPIPGGGGDGGGDGGDGTAPSSAAPSTAPAPHPAPAPKPA